MNDRFVRTGVFLAPFHTLQENPLLCLERDMELLIHLDRLNYHEGRSGCPNEKAGAARGYSRDLAGTFSEHDELDCFKCVSSPGLTGRPGNHVISIGLQP
jgi:hypothetical protein